MCVQSKNRNTTLRSAKFMTWFVLVAWGPVRQEKYDLVLRTSQTDVL